MSDTRTVNKHVQRLNRYLPSKANQRGLYEERLTSEDLEDKKSHETVTFRYLSKLVSDAGVSIVVLTGDAGHGKTHLCRRLLESYGATRDKAHESIRTDKRAERLHSDAQGQKRPLRILKDLSQGPRLPTDEVLWALPESRFAGIHQLVLEAA